MPLSARNIKDTRDARETQKKGISDMITSAYLKVGTISYLALCVGNFINDFQTGFTIWIKN